MEDFLTVHDECMRQISGEMKAGTLRPEVFFKMVVMDIFAISNVDNVPGPRSPPLTEFLAARGSCCSGSCLPLTAIV